MRRESVTPMDIVEFLNSIHEIDPTAVSNIFMFHILCNRGLAAHESVQVRSHGNMEVYDVGVLGILNGMFGTDSLGYGPITAIQQECLPYQTAITGFECRQAWNVEGQRPANTILPPEHTGLVHNHDLDTARKWGVYLMHIKCNNNPLACISCWDGTRLFWGTAGWVRKMVQEQQLPVREYAVTASATGDPHD